MEPSEIQNLRLQDLEPFEALGEIAKEFDVKLTLYGGTASRAAMHLAYRPEDDLDIFDLVPFSSDIDLEHTGPPADTFDILAAIQDRVPFASWFRWSLIDREKTEKARAQRDVSTRVPLRQIRFSTARSASLPEDALRDLEERRVSFSRNTAFQGADRDVEIYGLMMAVNVGAELSDIAGEAPTFDLPSVNQWLDTAALDFSTTAEKPRLAARFWHLASTQVARLGAEDPITATLLRSADATGVLDVLGVDRRALGAPGRAISVSKFTASESFRVRELTPKVLTGEAAREALQVLMDGLSRSSGIRLALDPTLLIDPAFELVAVVPELTISPYEADKADEETDHDLFFSGQEQEFVEIAWEHGKALPHHPHGLTAQVIPWDNLEHLFATSALPAVGGVFAGNRHWVRARLDDLVERRPAGKDGTSSLIVLQARDG